MAERRSSPASDRREPVHISPEQMQDIAERAADLAVQKVIDLGFKAVGKSIVERFLWIVGVCAVGAYVYLTKVGAIK